MLSFRVSLAVHTFTLTEPLLFMQNMAGDGQTHRVSVSTDPWVASRMHVDCGYADLVWGMSRSYQHHNDIHVGRWTWLTSPTKVLDSQ